jgi:hypothetical protein
VFLRRILSLGLLVTVLAAVGSTYALPDAHGLAPTDAPAAVAAAGVSVEHVSYEVDRLDPQRVSAVRLHLAADARGDVLTTLDGGTTWLSCTGAGRTLRCPTHGTQLRVQDATGLSIAPAA